jgi:hypothetical protein
MDPYSASHWKVKGSSIVYDPKMLGPLLATSMVVPLRVALEWLGNWPADVPGTNKTLVVGGLDTIIQVLPRDDAEVFIHQHVRRLIREFQDHCGDNCGLVFGVTVPKDSFYETIHEEVIYRRPDGIDFPIADAVWNGSAPTDMKRLVRTEGSTTVTGGYYAPRS